MATVKRGSGNLHVMVDAMPRTLLGYHDLPDSHIMSPNAEGAEGTVSSPPLAFLLTGPGSPVFFLVGLASLFLFSASGNVIYAVFILWRRCLGSRTPGKQS